MFALYAFVCAHFRLHTEHWTHSDANGSLHLGMSFFKDFQDVLLVFLSLDSQVCIDLDFDISRGYCVIVQVLPCDLSISS